MEVMGMLKTPKPQDLLDNILLRSLSVEARTHLFPFMQRIYLPLGHVVYDPGVPIENVYFPSTCVVSCLYTMQDGSTAEIALVGNDGVIGVTSFLGGCAPPHRAIAQIAGDAIKVPARLIRAEFARNGPLQHILLRYTQALIAQIAQTAVCNRLHSVEQRLCRWLLLCHDRVEGTEIRMTQEYIANMLGGRRESVTVAAGHLQDLSLIRYSRGHITIVDRKGLELMVCECYQTVKDEYERLIGQGGRANQQKDR
jgi:CRP-like cAMP-binding protein